MRRTRIVAQECAFDADIQFGEPSSPSRPSVQTAAGRSRIVINKLTLTALMTGLLCHNFGCARTSKVGDGKATADYMFGRCTVVLPEIRLAVGTHEWRLQDVPNSSMCLGMELPSHRPVPAGCVIRYSLLSESGNVLSTWVGELAPASDSSEDWWIIGGDWVWIGLRPPAHFEFGRVYTLRLEIGSSIPEGEQFVVTPTLHGFLDK